MKEFKTKAGKLYKFVVAAKSLYNNQKLPVYVLTKLGYIIEYTTPFVNGFEKADRLSQQRFGVESKNEQGTSYRVIPESNMQAFLEFKEKVQNDPITIELPEITLEELGGKEEENKYDIQAGVIFDFYPFLDSEWTGELIEEPDYEKYLD